MLLLAHQAKREDHRVSWDQPRVIIRAGTRGKTRPNSAYVAYVTKDTPPLWNGDLRMPGAELHTRSPQPPLTFDLPAALEQGPRYQEAGARAPQAERQSW